MNEMRRRDVVVGLLAGGGGLLAGCSGMRVGETPTPEPTPRPPPNTLATRLVPADGDENDLFGFSLTSDGDTALVGAGNDDRGDTIGSAYVFERDGDEWNERTTLLPENSSAGGAFGFSVALDGSTAVIGDYAARTPNGFESGAVYVFERPDGTWKQTAKLTAADGDDRDHLGISVSVFGDTILAGAWFDEDPNGPDVTPPPHPMYESTGAAYVFERGTDGWQQQTKLTPDDAALGDNFGTATALGDGVAVVGTGLEADDTPETGAAYVFERRNGSWEQQAKLTASDGTPGDEFGDALALDGNTLVVGAPGIDGETASTKGAAYVFERTSNGWREQAKLTADAVDEGDLFGWSVAVDDRTAVVGSMLDDDPNGEYGGAAYVFQDGSDGWDLATTLTSADGDSGDLFGSAVAVDGSTTFVGALNDDTSNGSNSGAVYVFVPQ